MSVATVALALTLFIFLFERSKQHFLLFAILGALVSGSSGVFVAVTIWIIFGVVRIVLDDIIPILDVIGKREDT